LEGGPEKAVGDRSITVPNHRSDSIAYSGLVQGGPSMITERAILAAVHISIWTAIKHDRNISRDVARKHGCAQIAAIYGKVFICRD
jgi:hypothetical protein